MNLMLNITFPAHQWTFSSDPWGPFSKVNSVQEACAKIFAVHIQKFEILQTIWKNKKHQNAKSICEKQKTFSYDLQEFKF